MTCRALLFDIGNTRVKWGVLDGAELVRTGSVQHSTLRERGMESLTRKLPKRVDRAIACNVAGPDVAKRLARSIGIHIGGDLRFAKSEAAAHGLVNGYRQPRSLGVDRWFAMLGAWIEFRSALCVVDAGTALTIDAIDADGRHLGGEIVPGIRLMGDVLAVDTSDIGTARRRPVPLEEPGDWFARTTETAVAAGAVNALCGAVNRAVALQGELGLDPVLVLTGGDASRILSGLGGSPEHRPNLVLSGLAHMVQSET
jgi:type III pantothenate kinase